MFLELFSIFNKTTDGTYTTDGQRIDLKTGYQVAYNGPLNPKKLKQLAKYTADSVFYIGVYKGIKELSLNIKNKNKALKLARKFRQFSIWNNATKSEIII